MHIDRVENWRRFSQHMENHILQRTVQKYGIVNSGGFDLISITQDPRICTWNVLKYALRQWNGNGKDHDLEKIAHYAELAWTLSEGKVVESEESDV